MSTVLVQCCVIFWVDQWNASDWGKCGNILVFSDTYFRKYVAYRAQRKPLHLHILCSVQLSLLVNLSTTLFFSALAKFCASSTKLAVLTCCSAFHLATTSKSVHLWSCNDTFIGQQNWIYWISTKFHNIQILFWCRYQIWTS